jgi:hypothetical protein
MTGWKFSCRLPRIFHRRKSAKARAGKDDSYLDYYNNFIQPTVTSTTDLNQLPGTSAEAKILRFLLSSEDSLVTYDDVIRCAEDYADIRELSQRKHQQRHQGNSKNTSNNRASVPVRRKSDSDAYHLYADPDLERDAIFSWDLESQTWRSTQLRIRASEWI